MTEQEWFVLQQPWQLSTEFCALPHRTLFLLGSAFLRRAGPLLAPWEVAGAVDVTEDYALGRASIDDLLEAWDAAEAATGDGLWLGRDGPWRSGCNCPYCTGEEARSEGFLHPGVRDAVRAPAVFASRAAFHALALVEEQAPAWRRLEVRGAERSAQHDLFCDLVGPWGLHRGPTPAVLRSHAGARAVLAALERQREPDPLALAALADALEEAGYAEERLLGHLRGPGPHYCGCWAVELLAGRAALELPGESTAVRYRERRFASW
jgi:hypothetical protein